MQPWASSTDWHQFVSFELLVLATDFRQMLGLIDQNRAGLRYRSASFYGVLILGPDHLEAPSNGTAACPRTPFHAGQAYIRPQQSWGSSNRGIIMLFGVLDRLSSRCCNSIDSRLLLP
jgi:hypothetical protein